MDCLDARAILVDHRRGRLPPPQQETLRTHLSGCEGCRRMEAAEATLDELLERSLPRRAAPARLKARLARMAEAAEGRDRGAAPAGRWMRLAVPALAAGLAVAVVGLGVTRRSALDAARAAVVSEAVSDHLRALASEHGPDLVSGESHEVKPWFEGRIDFAPVVPNPAVADLRLRGAWIGYFLDRKAAVVGYALRRHAVTLVAFRPDGLAWPEARGRDRGIPVSTSSERGFRVALWRSGGIGYALVADVAPEELDALAATFASATAP